MVESLAPPTATHRHGERDAPPPGPAAPPSAFPYRRLAAGASGTPALLVMLLLLGAGLVVHAAAAAAGVGTGPSNPFVPVLVMNALVDGLLGAAVARRRPGHPVAWFFQLSAALAALVVLTGAYVDLALDTGGSSFVAAWVLWLNRWLWVGLVAAPVLLLLAFPDGRLPGPRWRPLAWASVALTLPLLLQAMGTPVSDTFWEGSGLSNPLGPRFVDLVAGWGDVPAVALVLANGLALGAMVARRARASGELRDRLRWVLPAAATYPPALAASLLSDSPAGGLLEMLSAVALTITVTVATFRHRMFDVDVAINRALVYGLLVAALIGAYVGVVAVATSLVGGVSWLPGALGAAAVAVGFGPLLHLLRRHAHELLYGASRSPDQVAGRLLGAQGGVAPRAAPGDDDPLHATLVRSADILRSSLRLPWVRLECGDVVVTSGEQRTAAVALPLCRGDRVLGQLVVGRRYDDERLRDDDPRLAAAVAQLALTVDTILTAADLARARDQLATARALERERITRDLHDGLGPTLAGVCLGLETTERLASADPAAAARHLPALTGFARQAVDDVRLLIDGLRPADLDQRGLVASLRSRLAALDSAGGPELVLDLPDDLPALDERTDLAALRICLEAVTNTVRHAEASRCRVRIRVDGRLLDSPAALRLEIEDDGRGIGHAAPHVGLVSMRTRAAEAGGHLAVEQSATGGTRVRALLPLEDSPGGRAS